MPEVRELLEYWEESPPAHEMLQLIATSQFIGWERPGKQRKNHGSGRGNPPGKRSDRVSPPPEPNGQPNRGDEPKDGAPVFKGKYAHSIVVDDVNSMYVAAQTMSMLAGGKVKINRKR